MNTRQHVLSLLPLVALLAGSLDAQSLELATAVHPQWIDAKVAGAPQGSLVVLVLGLQETRLRLPGGAALGVSPDLVSSWTIANGTGPAMLGMRLPPDAIGLHCFLQAVSVDARRPLDTRGAIRVSNVNQVDIDRTDGTAAGGDDESAS